MVFSIKNQPFGGSPIFRNHFCPEQLCCYKHQATLEVAERQEGVPQVQRDLHANFKLLPTAARHVGLIPCGNDINLSGPWTNFWAMLWPHL